MDNVSFEKRLDEAKELIEKLMSQDITLEESISLYKQGLESLNSAQKMLEEAKLKVEEISKEKSEIAQ
jgi:exodeoxyribonuclease VII small subunit